MNNLLFNIICFLLALTFIVNKVNAQTIVDEQSFTIENGLNDRIINHIIRDSFGFFYLFSDVDILRYDGENFKSVELSSMITNNISPTEILSVDLGPSGKIWLQHEARNKILYINPGELEISEIVVSEKAKILANKYALHLYFPTDSSISRLIKLSDFSLDKKINIKTIPNKFYSTDTGYIIESNLGIHVVSKSNETIIEQAKILRLDSKIYIAAPSYIGVWNSEKFTKLIDIPVKGLHCKIFKTDLYGNLAFSYGDIPRYQKHIWTLNQNLEINDLNSITATNTIFKDFYTEDVSHRWALVGFNGLKLYNLLRPGAKFLKYKYPNSETFGHVILGVATDEENNIYYTKESKGLFKSKWPYDEEIELFVDKSGFTPFTNNGTMVYDSLSKHLFSYNFKYDNSSFINKINLRNENFERYNIPFKVNDFTVLSNSEILVGGFNKSDRKGTLYRLNINNNTREYKFHCPTPIHVVFPLYKQEIFLIGTEEGLFILNKNFEVIKTISRYSIGVDFLKNDYIRAITIYNNKILLGTLGGGVYIINPKSFKIEKNINTKNGLSDNKAVGFQIDNNNHCWISTWNGLNEIDSSFNILKKYFGQDGLPDAEFNTRSITKNNKGELIIGSINGLLVFNPEITKNWQNTSGLFIDQKVLFRDDQKTYVNNIYSKSNFDSIAIEIIKPDFFKYPFSFDPLEANIFPALNSPIIKKDDKLVLKGLSPNKYNLTISNTNEKVLETKIEIKRDFTLFLNIIGLILLSTLISSFFIKRHKNLEKEKSKINQKISALQLSSLQSQMNPHFIFNSLGAIQYFIQTNNIEKADDYLSNFAQLMRMILEASKSKFISLKNEIKLMDLYISLEEVRFESMFNYKIDIDPRIDMEFNIPPMIIQPYIENAVNHGLYNLKDKEGKLELSLIYIDENTIEIKIKDNGIGRKKAEELRNKNHKSRGMEIVNERIETFNNTERFSVNVEIYDHFGNESNSLGTEVIIRCTDFEA